jgi:o-succinylbenzoate synthase
MNVSVAPLLLKFKFDAGTSRGVLKTKMSWIVKLESNGRVGFGEVSPLSGLSIEFSNSFYKVLLDELRQFKSNTKNISISEYSSSTLFGLETALLDLNSNNDFELFPNPFYFGKASLPINGLVWMGNVDFMKEQLVEKLAQGFSCIKMKIGAIDFQEEYSLLLELRKDFPTDQLTLRVDANGAFSFEEAKEVLDKLNALDIHSIEQPIKAGKFKDMSALCRYTRSTGIALDEELIGVRNRLDKENLLDEIKPQYIILKPTLHGGISGVKEWIELAEQRDIKWWITSALESNIGLNAICQLTSEYNIDMPQGLGTGSLYTNNIPSPLAVNGEFISYQHNSKWDLSSLVFQEV